MSIMLSTNDQQQFPVSIDIESETIKNLIQDAGTDDPIPLPNVNGEILSRVIEYWNTKTIPKDIDQESLFNLILAANYLDIKSLLDDSCQMVADMIKGKTPEEIRKVFNIENDFTPEEEEQVRKENEWCEER